MGIFDNDDEFNDDFMNRWENFNNRMMNDEAFRKEMERTQKEIQNMMRMFFGTPLDFRITPLNSKDLNNFNIPENEMDIEKGKDENGDWETKSWTSPDGSISYSSFSRGSNFDDMMDLPDEIAERWQEKISKKNPEEFKNKKLAKLKIMLDKAVEQELYEKAAEIKKVMDELKSENKNT